jgi:hypothetical protein
MDRVEAPKVIADRRDTAIMRVFIYTGIQVRPVPTDQPPSSESGPWALANRLLSGDRR